MTKSQPNLNKIFKKEKFSVRGILELQWRHSEDEAKRKRIFFKHPLSSKSAHHRKINHCWQIQHIRY